MVNQLTEVEQDYSFSQGFIEEWLKDSPKQVKEHLATLVSGITAYREKYVTIQEDYDKLLQRYNELTAVSAQHLEFMRQQKEQLDEALVREQRQYHTSSAESGLIET
jgi:hypothetical protein